MMTTLATAMSPGADPGSNLDKLANQAAVPRVSAARAHLSFDRQTYPLSNYAAIDTGGFP